MLEAIWDVIIVSHVIPGCRRRFGWPCISRFVRKLEGIVNEMVTHSNNYTCKVIKQWVEAVEMNINCPELRVGRYY